MVEYNTLFAGRRMGKTWTIMNEIHEFVLAGRVKEVVVVFPDLRQAQFWIKEWRMRFPHVPVPDYVAISNILKLRGRHIAKVYVENVDHYEDGIYTARLQEIQTGLYSPLGDEEVVFTYTPLALNQRSHSVIASRESVMAAARKRVIERMAAEDHERYG